MRLGEACIQVREIVDGGSAKAKSLPYLSLEDIESISGKIRKSGTPLDMIGISTSFVFDKNHVLYGKLRPYLNKVALPDFPGRCTTEIIPLRPADHIDRGYLAWLLRREETAQEAMRGKTGSRMPRADMGDLLKMMVPIAPLIEQKRIVAILNEQMEAIDKARAAAEAQLDAAKALPAAYLRQVFPEEGKPLPSGWCWAKLRDICDPIICNQDPKGKPEEKFKYVDISSIDSGLKKIMGVKELYGKEAPSRARQIIWKDDILVSTTRPNLNAVAIVPAELGGQICSTGFCVLRAIRNKVMPRMLLYFVQSPGFVKSLSDVVKGAMYPAVTDRQVKAQIVPLAPLKEQILIVDQLDKQMSFGDKLRGLFEKQRSEINDLPPALLRRAFKGEL